VGHQEPNGHLFDHMHDLPDPKAPNLP
jgi:hypothetical protein